jgi:hypothetical protein
LHENPGIGLNREIYKMIQAILNSKITKIVYGVIFPLATITLLLGIASFNNRPRLKEYRKKTV